MLSYDIHRDNFTYPIRVGEKFLISGDCFNTIRDLGSDFDYDLPSYGFGENDFLFSDGKNASDIPFMFEYIGNGFARENSTGYIFYIRHCDWVYFQQYEVPGKLNNFYPSREDGENIYTLFSDGEFVNLPEVYNVETKTDYKKLKRAVEFYMENPLVVEYDLIGASSLDNKLVAEKYYKYSDEYRAEIINNIYKSAIINLKTFGPILTETKKRVGFYKNRVRKNNE